MAKKNNKKANRISTAEIQYLLQDFYAKERFTPYTLDQDHDGNIVYKRGKMFTPQVEYQRRSIRYDGP